MLKQLLTITKLKLKVQIWMNMTKLSLLFFINLKSTKTI